MMSLDDPQWYGAPLLTTIESENVENSSSEMAERLRPIEEAEGEAVVEMSGDSVSSFQVDIYHTFIRTALITSPKLTMSTDELGQWMRDNRLEKSSQMLSVYLPLISCLQRVTSDGSSSCYWQFRPRQELCWNCRTFIEKHREVPLRPAIPLVDIASEEEVLAELEFVGSKKACKRTVGHFWIWHFFLSKVRLVLFVL